MFELWWTKWIIRFNPCSIIFDVISFQHPKMKKKPNQSPKTLITFPTPNQPQKSYIKTKKNHQHDPILILDPNHSPTPTTKKKHKNQNFGMRLWNLGKGDGGFEKLNLIRCCRWHWRCIRPRRRGGWTRRWWWRGHSRYWSCSLSVPIQQNPQIFGRERKGLVVKKRMLEGFFGLKKKKRVRVLFRVER